jgi:CRP-like cAMP-binding protein
MAVIASRLDSLRLRWFRAPAPSILGFLGPGEIVGELSIIDGLPRSMLESMTSSNDERFWPWIPPSIS